MIDFSKWESLWDAYTQGGNAVPGTPASTYTGWGALLTAIGAIGIITAVIFSSDEVKYGSGVMPARKKKAAAMSVVVLVLGLALMFASEHMPSHFAHTSEPPALNERIVQVWGLDELDGCQKTKTNGLVDMLKGRGLPDGNLRDGDWKCVAYRDGLRFDATVHVKGHKVGLYTPDGRELKPAGKGK